MLQPEPRGSSTHCDIIRPELRVGSPGIGDREVNRICAGTGVPVGWVGGCCIVGDIAVTEIPAAVGNGSTCGRVGEGHIKRSSTGERSSGECCNRCRREEHSL